MGFRGDGDGWVRCAQGHRHWGLFGAAGLLLHHRDGAGRAAVLLQHRALWSHHGGTWSLLGGACDSDETAADTALREAAEEGGLEASSVRLAALLRDDHGGWSYHTVLAETTRRLDAEPTGGESADVRWVAVDDVEALPLHPGFGRTWPRLRKALVRLALVVDAANVVGARPDGWWRDRAGAARRLRAGLSELAREGVPDRSLPPTLTRPEVSAWLPETVMVVEGPAAEVAEDEAPGGAAASGGVVVRAASGSGDDTVVEVVRDRRQRRPEGPVLVVTADRELRARCAAQGAAAVGPRWLYDLMDARTRADGGGTEGATPR